ncbi:MAG: hypothetical protein R2710_25745 [Acidimicrobiales bacterium]
MADDTYMDTSSEAIARLETLGYVEQFRLDDDGMIEAGNERWPAESISVDQSLRFEGMSNPDDESIVLAVSGPGDRKGVLTLPYGPDLAGPAADTVRLLAQQRRI